MCAPDTPGCLIPRAPRTGVGWPLAQWAEVVTCALFSTAMRQGVGTQGTGKWPVGRWCGVHGSALPLCAWWQPLFSWAGVWGQQAAVCRVKGGSNASAVHSRSLSVAR